MTEDRNDRTFSRDSFISFIKWFIRRSLKRGTSDAEAYRIFNEWDEDYNK